MNDELTENGTYINIEYHKSRVSELEKQLAKYDEIAAEYGIDGKTMLTLAKSQIETAKENIVLREALEESQRREKAAVEDLIHTICNCKFSKCCDMAHATSPKHDTCFTCSLWEWRGPQDEKGDDRET